MLSARDMGPRADRQLQGGFGLHLKRCHEGALVASTSPETSTWLVESEATPDLREGAAEDTCPLIRLLKNKIPLQALCGHLCV